MALERRSVTRVALRRAEAALVFLTSFGLAAAVIRYKHHVEVVLSTIGPWVAYPLAIVVFAIVASAPFSVTDALAIMNGVIFGPLWGSVVNAIGLVLARSPATGSRGAPRICSNSKKTSRSCRHGCGNSKSARPRFLITLRIIPMAGGTLADADRGRVQSPDMGSRLDDVRDRGSDLYGPSNFR